VKNSIPTLHGLLNAYNGSREVCLHSVMLHLPI
jgi:hypothetical protein